MKNQSPPKYFLKFFRWFCHPKLRDSIEGDLMELYEERIQFSGKRKADIRFILDILLLFRPSIIRPAEGYQTLNTYGMYKNYFKTGWRSIVKNKGYAYINIIGLTAGISITLLITLWIIDELEYNKFHANYSRIARVSQHQVINNEIKTSSLVPFPVATELKNTYNSDYNRVIRMLWERNHILSVGERKISRNGTFMNKEGLEMFSYSMISGSWKSLNDPLSIVLSEGTAKALFGDDDPMNQQIRVDNFIDLTVTGVFKELPDNTQFKSLAFISSWEVWASSNNWMKDYENDWNSEILTFVEIHPHASFESLSAKIRNLKFDNLPEAQAIQERPELFLHPMRDWHLHSEWKKGSQAGGRIHFVWLFGLIGFFVLLLACINFINLSTAQAEKRAKEVGIRKSIGSNRSQLIGQFFTETFLLVILAFILALGVDSLALPFFNELAGKEMKMPWNNSTFFLIGTGFILLTSFMAGSYPAFFLSSFQPVKVLKGTFKAGRFTNIPRKVLVVFQFSVSVVLIISTVTVWKQIQFAKNRPVGYTREGLIMIRKNSPDFWGKLQPLKNSLMEANAIVGVAESESPATENWISNNGFNWQGKNPNEKIDFATVSISHDYGSTMGWSFINGRDFSTAWSTDSSAIILNETAARTIGFEDPINQEITWNNKRLKIIGVIQDMLVDSPYETAKPTIFWMNDNGKVWFNIRLNPNLSTHEAISRIEKVFQSLFPAVPFEFEFIDQAYQRKFVMEERVGKLASIFGFLAIFISSLGVFGLASFIAQQRTKEIGIRKVMGATVVNVWMMLSKEFLILVIISIGISIPIAWYSITGWLQTFEYRTSVPWWIYAVTGISALMVTMLSVSYQTIKAALVNPVKSLKSD